MRVMTGAQVKEDSVSMSVCASSSSLGTDWKCISSIFALLGSSRFPACCRSSVKFTTNDLKALFLSLQGCKIDQPKIIKDSASKNQTFLGGSLGQHPDFHWKDNQESLLAILNVFCDLSRQKGSWQSLHFEGKAQRSHMIPQVYTSSWWRAKIRDKLQNLFWCLTSFSLYIESFSISFQLEISNLELRKSSFSSNWCSLGF